MRKFYDIEYGGGYSSDPKLYIAKFLPVEGKIKEGDRGVLLLINNIPTPHKFFLCSRDNPEIGIAEIEELWVKEGMEFSEEEIMWRFLQPYEDDILEPIKHDYEPLADQYYGKKGKDYARDYYPKQISIKCPCCHNFM